MFLAKVAISVKGKPLSIGEIASYFSCKEREIDFLDTNSIKEDGVVKIKISGWAKFKGELGSQICYVYALTLFEAKSRVIHTLKPKMSQVHKVKVSAVVLPNGTQTKQSASSNCNFFSCRHEA